MNIIFSESSGLNDSIYGKCQAPIRMFLEKRGEEFERSSVLKNLFFMGKSGNYADMMTTMTAMSGFEPVGENGAYPLDGMQEGYQKLLKYQTWKDSFSVSKEMIEDGKLLDMRKQPAAFMTSYKRTRELFGAALYGAAMMGNGSVTFKGVKFDLTGADGSSVSSVYADDYLTSLSHSGGDSSTTYNFSYGVAGLSTAVKIGETWTLVSNSYNTGAWTLAQQLYGNGLWWKYDYDAQTDDLLRRYTNLSDNTGTGYAYTYDSRGQISKIEKKSLTLENGAITGESLLTAEYYGYDAMDRLTRIVVTDGTNLISDIAWTYDADQNVTAITTRVNNNGTLRTDTYAYSYDDDHRPTNTAYGSVSESITYDGYSRVTGKTVQNSGNTVLSTSYAYRDIDAQYTTTQVSSLTNTFGGNTLSHSYTYDANGNILSDGSTTYAYDSLNQLVWEYNTAAGKAWNYAYDLGGNILSKTEYDYADGQTSNPVTVSYTYGDAAWRDLLTAYNGEAITYDGIGNPTSYRGWGMTWQGGRQLASMQKDGTTISFSYNDAGLRTEKTVNGSTRRYIWNSSQLMADVGASDAFYFHYSSGGELIGYTYKTAEAETECILVKNQQGDVEKVISADGTILASYTYDAWGNVLTSEGSLATANPIRYRGYYFDTETSLYYLQSRYYDPAIGRFINADGYTSTDANGLLSANMFAYCENNPISRFDPEGTDWRDAATFGLVVAGVGLLILATLPFSGPLLAAVGVTAATAAAAGTAITATGMAVAGGALTVAAINNSASPDYHGHTTYNDKEKNERIEYEYYGNGNGNVHHEIGRSKTRIWKLENGVEHFFDIPKKIVKVLAKSDEMQSAIDKAIEIVKNLAGVK